MERRSIETSLVEHSSWSFGESAAKPSRPMGHPQRTIIAAFCSWSLTSNLLTSDGVDIRATVNYHQCRKWRPRPALIRRVQSSTDSMKFVSPATLRFEIPFNLGLPLFGQSALIKSVSLWKSHIPTLARGRRSLLDSFDIFSFSLTGW